MALETLDLNSPDAGQNGQALVWSLAIRPYGYAAGAVVVATVVRWALTPVLGMLFPYATYMLAVVAVAIGFGWRPGATALALSFLAANFYFVTPVGSFLPTGGVGLSAGIIYLINGGIIVALAQGMTKAR